jgi:predicted trehalose synthase
MLRSFDYALATAGVVAGAPPLREAFLEGYAGGAAGAPAYLPAAAAARAAWCDFFELDKALYELEYEMNNRPDWVHLPLAGILRVLGRAGGER